jgi:GntR family transcriptional regulator, transcriptional repressor for pyruvate dehydrogenase complex
MSGGAPARIDWSSVHVGGRSVADDLVARLRRMIFDGELAPGARLPPERELQSVLGVSRVSVREALYQLELQGLVDRRPGRGTVVVAPDRSDRAPTLLAILTAGDRDLLELMDLRAAIEPPIAARAAARATVADVQELRDLVDEMQRTSAVERVIELDEAFHAAIGRATHNPLFAQFLDVIRDWLHATRRGALQSDRRRRESIEAHTRIVAAISARDADAAATAMREHIEAVNRLLEAGS